MKKNYWKTLKSTALACVALVSLCVLSGCGQTKQAATLTGYYTSDANVGFFSAYPEYTYKQATFGIQVLETYSDGTYRLTQNDTLFSGGLLFNDDGTFDATPRGAGITQYQGAFTSTESDGLLTVKLAAPTAIVANSSVSAGAEAIGYVNTAAWTDKMGTAVGGENGSMTAADYLASAAYGETTLVIDTASSLFDYAPLTPANAG